MICAYSGPDVKESAKRRGSVSIWFDDYTVMNTLMSKGTYCDCRGWNDAMQEGNMNIDDLQIITEQIQAKCVMVSLYNIKNIFCVMYVSDKFAIQFQCHAPCKVFYKLKKEVLVVRMTKRNVSLAEFTEISRTLNFQEGVTWKLNSCS